MGLYRGSNFKILPRVWVGNLCRLRHPYADVWRMPPNLPTGIGDQVVRSFLVLTFPTREKAFASMSL